jgi:crotonobetainyl-CoA:carnitine CoA-transferase CaiB-like acyl-CoA transferase
MPRLPLQVGRYDFKKRTDPPAAIGADTRSILAALGYTDAEVRALVEKQIIAG